MERVKRPVLDRDAPNRGWTSALGPDEAPRQAAASTPPPIDNSQDPIVRGVVLGGRVVDEWIRQAQQTARLLSGTGPAGAWPDASGRMLKATSDLMTTWFTALGMSPQNGAGFWPGMQPGATTPADPGWRPRHAPEATSAHEPRRSEAPRPEPSTSPTGRLRLELTSRRPVEVIVDLRKRAAHYRVLDLRSERSDASRISEVVLEACDQDGVRLRLRVPDTQPGGSYHAVVLDPVDDCAIGTVTLKIPE